jgi:2-hydroxycyclohexanecarboxyl-CoA dehydrogenase
MSSRAPSPVKVAIVTGAGAGIGRACAQRLAGAGWAVVVVDVDAGRAEKSTRDIEGAGGAAVPVHGDISLPATSQGAARIALERWGRIDTLIANAGIQTGGRLLDMSETDWRRVMAVNLDGVAHACRAVLTTMVQQHSGSIVIISSVNVQQPVPGMAAYDASKAAVAGLGRQLAVEHGADGVRVNVLCPGNTITDYHIDRLAAKGVTVEQIREMTRGYGLLGRAAEPGEIAACAHFLAGDDASFVTGQVLVADGGFSLSAAAPG